MSHLDTIGSLASFRGGSRGFLGEFHYASIGLQSQSNTFLPAGELNYFSIAGTTVTISGVSDGATNLVPVAPASTLSNVAGTYFDNGGSNDGTLRYHPPDATPRVCWISVTFNGLPVNTNDDIVFCLYVDGTPILNNRILWGGNSRSSTCSVSHVQLVQPLDTIRLYVGNTSAARDVTCHGLVICVCAQ